jgi:epoxide hydrolase-like predicted phosphatase
MEKMIRNIVLDFGGVLVAYDFKAYFSKILNSEEKGEWFMENILTPANNNLLDKGDQSFEDIISEWKQRWPDYAVALDAFDKHYTDIFTEEIPGIYDWMVKLKSKGYRLLGLSNWSTKVFDVMKKFPRPFSLLDGYLVSHEVHLLKPDVAIYQAFCQRFDVDPSDCVFIDDKVENIRGAQKIGMHGIVFRNTEEAREQFHLLLK